VLASGATLLDISASDDSATVLDTTASEESALMPPFIKNYVQIT